MKIGLFPGTFNPVHIGHLIIADYMREHADLDEVWFIVSPQNPLKDPGSLLDEGQRLEMVKLATADHAGLKVSDIEFSLPRPSYTIDTMQELAKQHPNDELILIMGTDNLSKLKEWKDYETILNGHKIFAYERQGYERNELFDHENVTVFDMLLLQVSASEVRDALAAGRSISGMLPSSVAAYIKENRLYITA